jgi:hypothetical protein
MHTVVCDHVIDLYLPNLLNIFQPRNNYESLIVRRVMDLSITQRYESQDKAHPVYI